ncbi:MAG: twin-arginine translocase subunit TatC [Chloroflexi bacterium]|nr:twin-arginine translocase subunit TatC [Chloroflexota bacterium]
MGDQKLTVLGHLNELRQRLIRSVIAVVITTALSFIFADRIFQVLLRPAGDTPFIYTEVTEMMGTYMKVCLAAGIGLAMPYLVFQLIMFVSPALTRREKRYVYLVIPWIALMFLGGVAFGYFFMLPRAIEFLVGFGGDIASPQIKIGNYISLITKLLLAVGLSFEMPVITTFLARLGVVKPGWLAGRRKFAVVAAFIIGAIITPTMDPVNQTFIAAPLIVLYELSIWLAKLVQPRRAKALAPAPAADGLR